MYAFHFEASVKALQGMKQPIPTTMHRGHIPGSKNILESSFINPNTNCFNPPQEIEKGESEEIPYF